jgi:type IV pilus assembly protein PilW
MLSRRDSQGFTLIELMTSIAIFGVAMAAIYSAYLSQQKAYQVTEATTETQQNLRAAMYTLEREIRMAGYDPKGSKSFGFTSPLQSSVITFSYDANEDGLAGTTEYFRFQRDSTKRTLERQIGGSGGPPPTSYTYSGDIADRIDSVVFQYLDSNGAATVSPTAVSAVVVTLSASKDDHTRQLSTRIQCRNRGL